jgi:hypothetical protein
MIAVPTYDGKVSVPFTDALIQSFLKFEDIQIIPAYIIGDANLAKARNELFALAYTMGFDDIVFVDSDIIWTADALEFLLRCPEDFVGGSYPIKTDKAYAVVKFTGKIKVDPVLGLAKVDALGTGFLKLSRRAMKKLWEAAPRFTSPEGKTVASVFEFTFDPKEGHVPEDVGLCRKWRAMGEDVYLHTLADVDHMGTKIFRRPVLHYLKEYDFLDEVAG